MDVNSTKKRITVAFQQDEFVGEIIIDLGVDSIREKIAASFAFPPFEELIKFLEDILSNHLPSEFVLDEEGVFKKFNAIRHHDSRLFTFVLGFPAHVYMEGVFEKKQFVSEFYEKFVAFLSSSYDKNWWTNGNESLDLKKISLEKLKKLIEKMS